MKKIFTVTIVMILVSLLSVGTAFAQKGMTNIKGEVTAMGGGSLTVVSAKGDTYIVTIPDGMELSGVEVGRMVLIKASKGEGDAFVAESVKVTGKVEKDTETDTDKEEKDKDADQEGSFENNAFCSEGKQDKPHPLAPKIAERYGVSEEMVMGYFCDGYSMGAIMLAIKTSQLDGVTASIDELLTSRADGNGWGQIWKELKLIGSEKDGKSPPGLLHKPEHAGPKK